MTRSRLAEEHHRRRVHGRPWREFPYKTQAVLGPKDKLHNVTVLSASRSMPIKTALKGIYVGMNLVSVLVEGETEPRDIAVERLEEKP